MTGQCVDRSTAVATATGGAEGAPATVIILGPDGTPCGAMEECKDLPLGSRVTFRAPTIAGHRFVQWEGAAQCVGTAPELVIESLSADTRCTARYVRRVRVTAVDGGEGSVTIGSNSANARCMGLTCEVDSGSEVVLTAIPGGDARFRRWTGAGCEGTMTTLRLTARDSDLTCTADYGVRRTVSGTAVGTEATIAVTSESAGAECSAALCSVDGGSSVTLTAPVVPGHRFTGWSGTPACAGADPTLHIASVSADEACTASYLPRRKVTVTSEGAPADKVKVQSQDAFATCAGNTCEVDFGGAATLVAESATGVRLVGWSGARCEGQVANAIELQDIQADVACVAKYVPGIGVAGAVFGAIGEVEARVLAGTTGTCARGSCSIDVGGSVSLTAPMLEDHRFVGWEGDPGCTGTQRTITLMNVTASKSCLARYTTRLRVRGVPAPAGSGSVVARSSNSTASCTRDTCVVDAMTDVTLEAVAGTGQRFAGWSGGGPCTGQRPTIEIADVSTNVTCTANFVGRFTVTGVPTPASGGSVVARSNSPDAACSGASCVVDATARVVLTAMPASGYRFVNWSDCGNGSDATLAIESVQRTTTCRANFERETYPLTVGRNLAGGEVAIVSPTPMCSGTSCMRSFTGGTEVTIEARPTANYAFQSWSGCITEGGARATVTINAATTCTANFVRTYNVALRARHQTPSGPVEMPADSYAVEVRSSVVNCTGATCRVPEESSVTLSAAAANESGWQFERWQCTGAQSGSTATLALTITADTECTALFREPVTYQVGGIVFQGTTPNSEAGIILASSTFRWARCSGPSCSVTANRQVSLTVTAIGGSTFVGWSCDNGQTGTDVSIVVAPTDDDVECRATFAP